MATGPVPKIGRRRRHGRSVAFGALVAAVAAVGAFAAFGTGGTPAKPHPLAAASTASTKAAAAKAAEIQATLRVSARYNPHVPTTTCDGTPGVQVPVCRLWEALTPAQMAVSNGQNLVTFAPKSVTISASGTAAVVTGCELERFAGHTGEWWAPGVWAVHRSLTSAPWGNGVSTRTGGVSCKGL